MSSTGVKSEVALGPVGTSLLWNSNKERERAFMGCDFDTSAFLVL